MRTLTSSELRSQLAAVLDDVECRRAPVAVTRRGRIVAVIEPVRAQPAKDPLDALRGTGVVVDDIVAPAASWRIGDDRSSS